MLDFLKTIPDMTNTPEITMTPKIPATKRIRAYKAANPDATAKQVADATGTTVIYVYQVLSDSNRKAKKAKPVKEEKKQSVPTLVQLTNQISFMESQIRDLRSAVYELEAVAKGLRQQNRGLSNVITYLESKLGIDEIDARLESTKD